MDTQKQSIIDRLKQANNILVTVSKDPSVDQLAAAIGFTLALNKLGKHAIAVFSGQAPSTIEFLKPEETFEKTTDSLRDFIISLDKAKADKLRYKVEDEMVKIFITPYRTSLSDKDLEFSQGDFNVEVVVALGVHDQQDLDAAITSQGRILHDATVIDINLATPAQLGTLSWANNKASSLCEMVLSLIDPMKADLLDAQMATALLTGIVAETDRFSNEKTTPDTMQASSKLMAAGANQQLVAQELQPPTPEPEPEPAPEPEAELPAPVEEPEPTPAPVEEQPVEEAPAESKDGSLEISHEEEKQPEPAPAFPGPEALADEEEEDSVSQIVIDEHGQIHDPSKVEAVKPPSQTSSRGMTLEPPTLGGKLTANSEPEKLDPSTDILGAGAAAPTSPILSHQATDTGDEAPTFEPPQTLASLEQAVNSPHLSQYPQGVAPAAPEAGQPSPADPNAPPAVPPPMMPPNFGGPGSNDTSAL